MKRCEHYLSKTATVILSLMAATMLWTMPVTSAPILSITSADAPDPVSPGNQIVYTINYSNTGTDAATNVVVTESYDANVTFVSAVPAPDVGNNQWNIGGLAAGASGSITVTVLVNSPLANGTILTNTVTLTATEGTVSDSETTTVSSAPVLSITKIDNVDPVSPGNQIVYTINYSNTGTVAATNVVVTESYDANVTFVSAIPAPDVGNNQWNIGGLAAGASGSITVTVLVNSPLVNGTVLTNTVTLTATEGTVSDSETTTVTADLLVEAYKVDSLQNDADTSGDPTPGDTLRYTVTVTNTGNTAATGVTFTDTVPANTTYVVASLTSTLGSADDSGDPVLSVDIGTLNVGVTVTITFDVLIDDPLPAGVTQVSNQGAVTSNELPDEPTDDPDVAGATDPTVTAIATLAVGTVQFAVSSTAVSEAAGQVTLDVTRTSGLDGAITVNFASADGTAVAPDDYTAVSSQLSWADQDGSTQQITVPIIDDTNVEGDETFSVTLNDPAGASFVGTPAAVMVTIQDNDQVPGIPTATPAELALFAALLALAGAVLLRRRLL